MITRCPHCATHFRVAAAQLEIREGMVRCGRCSAIFNARDHLNEEPNASAPEAEPLHIPQPRTAGQRRFAAVAAIVLLAATLAAQLALANRTAMAARWPDSKPLLSALCAPLGCQVGLARDIARVTIEASKLEADADRRNVVRLTAVLRNRSSVAQDYPALEVTLTDGTDRALARRSLNADQYLAEGRAAGEGLAPGGEAIAQAAFETMDLAAAGYRLRLHYR